VRDYGSNSNKGKETPIDGTAAPKEKVITKVTTGEVVVHKKTVGKKVKEALIGADTKSVAIFVLTQKIVPAVKLLVVDAGSAALERFMYGENAVQRRTLGQMQGSRVIYNTPPSRGDRRTPGSGLQLGVPRPGVASMRAASNDDYVLTSKEEAELVLDNMRGVIDAYDVVSVADLNELVGFEAKHTDNNYGWRSLSGARVISTRDGYLLDLPPAQQI
jgi:hypothetical protein